MPAANLNYAWAGALVQELVRGGVRHAVVCPGSRSSPLAIGCASAEGLRTWPVVDERSAGFFALGLARASGAPVALVSTSGSAGAHFLPAAIEAAMSGVPLVILTADRPPELQGWGAPQTIPQQGLYGRFARESFDLPVPEGLEASFLHLRATAARAVSVAGRAPMGPVHLNVPLREPLAPAAEPLPALSAHALDGRPGEPFVRFAPPARASDAEALRTLRGELERCERGVIICGPRAAADGFGAAVRRLGRTLGYPVFAEAASNARFGFGPDVVAHFETLLQQAPFAAEKPDVVLKFGGGLTSKRLQSWIDGSGAKVVLFSDEGALFDPAHASELVIEGPAPASCEALLGEGAPRESRWWTRIHAAEARVRAALEDAFADGRLTEPAIARAVAASLPAGGQLFVSSSMPIRELDAYAIADRPPLRVLANRGANGIDGITSSALGMAAATGRPTTLLVGDLAFLHDLGGLLAARATGVPLTVVVVNNDGGGIFSFLPIARFPEHFERLFGTPHGVDLAHAAALAGATHRQVATPAELASALRDASEGGLRVIEARVPRDANPAEHQALLTRALKALDEEGAR